MNQPSYSKWKILLLLSIAELLGMSLWMTASAVSPQLAERWHLGDSQSALLTTVVQIGFVVGTAVAALLNWADVFRNRDYFVVCALLSAAANGLLLLDLGFSAALIWRFLTGFFLAGVYPPAMKMIATWFDSGRGFAIGTVVGALTIGKATPYLMKALGDTDWQWVVATASLFAVAAAVIVWTGYRDGPFAFQRKPFSLALTGEVFKHRRTRLAIFGYLGHMWELYAMWVWLPIFLAASARQAGLENPTLVDLVSFSAIAAGGLGCIWGGKIADRIGRGRFVNICMTISGLCCVCIGFLFGGAFWAVAMTAIVWGFFVVADSAQFSTMVTEVAPQHAVGTALTLQTSLGFGLTVLTIQLIAAVEPWVSWQFAFSILAVGPLFGVMSIIRLAPDRHQHRS